MKFLFLASYFYPEIGSMRIGHEFGQFLVSRGHEVFVVTPFPRARFLDNPHLEKLKKYNKGYIMRESIDGLNILRVGRIPNISGSASYLFELFLFPFYLLLGLILSPVSDVIHLSNNPPTAWIGAYLFLKLTRRHTKIVLRADDMYPENLVEMGMIKNKVLIAFLNFLLKVTYRLTDSIVVHSDANKQYLGASKGIPYNKIKVVPLWASPSFTKTVYPRHESQNDYSKRIFKIFFGGLISYAQGLQVLIQAAYLLRKVKKIKFILIGRGPEKNLLIEEVKKLGLKNVEFHPLLSSEEYQMAIFDSDVCMVTLNLKLKVPVVPSKILDYMACRRPIIVACSSKNEALKELVNRSGCGLFVEPDAQSIVRAILTFFSNREFTELAANSGYEFLIRNLTLETVGVLYENALSQ